MLQTLVAVILVIVGSALGTPPVVLIGLVLALAEVIRHLWTRSGMRGVEYSRRLPSRGVVGDAIPLDVTVWNRKALPLAWLRAADEASPGVTVRERDLVGTSDGQALANVWTLAPFERVTRHFHVVAERRGVYSLGPVGFEVGDLFARAAATATSPSVEHWLVRPRTLTVTVPERDDPWGGERRALHGLIADPTRYAGVRPYQSGDPMRAIHWRATARTGAPVTRLYEPGRHPEIVVAIDLQTIEGPQWSMNFDDDAIESLVVAAASLVRRLRADDAAVGLAAAGYAGAVRPFTFLAPDASNEQVGRCLDVLARLDSIPAASFDRLLTKILRVIGPGTSIVALSVRDAASFVPALRRVAAAGHPVQLVALGSKGATSAARARTLGIDARPAHLDGPWRTATALVIG